MNRKPRTREEIVARALCRYDGNPEGTRLDGEPMWTSYIPQAETVLQALDAEMRVGA